MGQGKKSVARKPTPVKPFTKMSVKEYTVYRERNSYLLPRQDNVANPRFYTNDQERVYDEVYLSQRSAVVKQDYLNIPHMTCEKNRAYFAEAYAMCERFGLLPSMVAHENYDEELIGQFYATVHVGNEKDPILSWMIRDVPVKVV